MKRVLLIAYLLSTVFVSAQKTRVDTLIQKLAVEKIDTTRQKLLTSITFLLVYKDPDKAMEYSVREMAAAEKMKSKPAIVDAYLNRGLVNYYSGKYPQSIECYEKAKELFYQISPDKRSQNDEMNLYNNFGVTYQQMGKVNEAVEAFNKSLELKKKTGNQALISTAYLNIGVVYYKKGDFKNALKNYLEAAKIREKINSKDVHAVYVNIGVIYVEEKQYAKALEFYDKALKISEKGGDPKGAALLMNNIGIVYYDMRKFDTALVWMKKSLKIREDEHDKNGISESSSNLAAIYEELKDYENAEYFVLKSVKISEEIGDASGLVYALQGLARIYIFKNKYKEAEKLLERCISLATESGANDELVESYKTIAGCYHKSGDYKKSTEYYRKFISVKDSLYDLESSKQMADMQTKYETEKKEQEIKLLNKDKDLLNKDKDLQTAQLTEQKIIIWSAVLGLIVVVVFSVFLFQRFRITNRQKRIIELQKTEVEKQRDISQHQKHLIEEKQKEIIDSITYAKRIQDALLKDEEHVSKHLPEHFVLYKPKDIIAGDFYWAFEKGDYWYVAAADCTGHGVPGAMMSMLGMSFLNEIISSATVLSTADILNQLRDKIVKEMRQTGRAGESKDGMDISLLRVDLKDFQKAGNIKMQWSGANNQLWYIRQSEMKEITADKQPIGYYPEQKKFTAHDIHLQKGDVVYLMTDGYPDQFGGPKGKKFKYKQLQENLLALRDKSLDEQKETLSDTFETWKGDLEQVDDVTIIGIRL